MEHYTKQDILRMAEEEEVEFIHLQFTDIFGTMKNVAVTAGRLKKALDNQIMFDGSSIEGFAGIEDSDMYLHPDPDTFAIFPWKRQQGNAARLICDVYKPDGTVFESDPRYVLKKALSEAKAMGYDFLVRPECEFFLFHTDEDGRPTTLSHESATYFDPGPLDLGENARRDMVLTLEEMGFVIEASHHETAPAQHEIDFQYGEALWTADNIMTFKQVVKTIAKRHGLHATFMPKPKTEENGSGMHTNMSLSREGRNIFQDSGDPNGLSREAYYFIGGILKHARGITAITNPLVNSYKRLFPAQQASGYMAPGYVAWSAVNRAQLIRIPAQRGENVRIELRSPDPSCNPYLALALCLAAGLEGIREQILPPDPVDQSSRRMTDKQRQERGIESLPRNLLEALNAMEADELVTKVLGEKVSRSYCEAKRREWEEYCTQVSAWEIDSYLYRI